MKLPKTVWIYDPIYRINLYAYVGDKISADRAFKMSIGRHFDFGNSNGKFMVTTTNTKHGKIDVGLIWAKSKGIYLIHECLHATFWVMEERGVELDEKSEEAFTYHQTFLLDKILGGKSSKVIP